MRNRMLACLGLAASVCLLVGCAPAPELPRDMTPDELAVLIEQSNRTWWASMFPDEPMPEIEPIAYLTIGDSTTLIDDCLLNANIPGMATSDGTTDVLNRRYFFCAMAYPTDYTGVDLAEIGWLGQGQLGWLYDYLTERSAPCLSLLGYRIPAPPEREDYIANYYTTGSWNPYYQAMPFIDEPDWPIVDFRCPPPALGGAYHS